MQIRETQKNKSFHKINLRHWQLAVGTDLVSVVV